MWCGATRSCCATTGEMPPYQHSTTASSAKGIALTCECGSVTWRTPVDVPVRLGRGHAFFVYVV